MTRKRSKSRKHIVFWSFPIITAVLFLLCIWLGGGYVLGKARPILEKVISMVTIL